MVLIGKELIHRLLFQNSGFPRLIRRGIVLFLYLIAFSVFDSLTRALEIFPGVVAWYPPDGLSLAFLLALGAQVTPGFTLASLISSLIIYRLSVPLGDALIWAVILSSVYGIDAFFLYHFLRIDRRLNNLRDIFWLILTTALSSTILAFIAVYALVQRGALPPGQFIIAFIPWWIGEMIGVLVFTPFFLVYILPALKKFIDGEWSSPIPMGIPHFSLESIFQIISIPVSLYLTFGIPGLKAFQLFYLIAFPLTWIALRNGFPKVSIAIVAMNLGTMLAVWYFQFDPANLGELQFLFFGIYLTTLLTGVIVRTQKRSEMELSQREVRYRALIENAPDAISLLSADLRLQYTSPSTQRILGYPSEAIPENLDLENLIHPEDKQSLKELLDKVNRQPGKVFMTWFRFRHLDGSWRWLESTITNLLQEPSVQAYVFNYRDITERKMAEETIHKNEKKFRALLEQSLEEVSLVDENGKLTYESPTLRRPLGYPPNAFVGHNLLDMFHPDDRADAARVLEQVVQQPGNVVDASFRVRHKNGSWRWMEGVLTNLLEEPEIRSIVINYRDVTERKQNEEEIKNRNEELSMLFELSHSLAEADTLESILELVNRHSVEGVHTTFARIALLEGEKLIFHAAYPIRQPKENLQVGDRIMISALPICLRVMDQTEPVILQADDPQISAQEKKALLLEFAQSICLIPLRISDSSSVPVNYLGLLMLGEERNQEREPFTPNKIRLAKSIADSAAVAIRRMLLSQQTERRLQQFIALSEIDSAIISSFNLHTSLEILLAHVIRQLKIDAACVRQFIPASKTLEVVCSYGFLSTAYGIEHPLQQGEGYAWRAALEQQLIFIPDLATRQDNPRLMNTLTRESIVSYYGVPLIVKGAVKGVLELFHRSLHEPDAEWLDLLNALASQAAIAIDNSSLLIDLQNSNADLTQAYDATIQGWSRALDLRDNETEGHTQRVTELTMRLAGLFGISDEELVHIRRGALLHDIGKMGVPDAILLKPGSLTADEWVIMRKHPTFAHDMLSPIDYLKKALDIPFCHHEKWDGSGYPRGLKGTEIPLAARIFSVVDVWDALRSDRPYRNAWTEECVREYLNSVSGTQFDPEVLRICLESGLLK
jgi:PAS domain S-box-containing protein